MIMDERRKKELIFEYRNRKPEKGIICFKCTAVNESFLMASNDTKASLNSVSAKLSMGFHPNKRLLELWKTYGVNGFELSVIHTLKYDDPSLDYSEKLEKLLEECLESDKNASRIWK